MKRAKLIFGSLGGALAIFAVAVISQILEPQTPLLKTGVQAAVTLGSAPTEVLLIEDFECRNCMSFSQLAVPQIKRQYVDSGKIKFTLIPIAFLAGSQAIGNAILEMQKQAPQHAFTYLEQLLDHYRSNDLKTLDLVNMARDLNGVDLGALQYAIETGSHNAELEHNYKWAKNAMGSRFKTPALYNNGAPCSIFSFEAIQNQIEQMANR